MDPSRRIDEKIADLADWRGRIMAGIRKTIHEADPRVVEEWKWMGTPVWCHDGNLCLANAHKNWVNLVFAKGAGLPDPEKLFNAMLEGGTWRAIKFLEGDKINERALKNLIRAAIAFNLAKAKGAKPVGRKPGSSKPSSKQAGRKK